MQNKHYYLVASLPYLRFGEKSPISRDVFIDECRKWLDQDELDIVERMDIKEPDASPEDIPLVAEWKEFDSGLKAVIAEYRLENKHAVKRTLPEHLKNVFDETNPLTREKMIEKIRWSYIEGEEHKYLFETKTLALYMLKIQILERLAEFDQKKGKKRFEDLCEVEHGEPKR
jgi:hypothetical protein